MTEKNFHHTKQTTTHAPPDMKATYAALAAHMEKNNTHLFQPGRTTEHLIKDMIEEGLRLMDEGGAKKGACTKEDEGDESGDEGGDAAEGDDNGEERAADGDDLNVEFGLD